MRGSRLSMNGTRIDRMKTVVKAFSHLLSNDERAQVINYLKATGAPVGLSFNLG